MLEHDEWFAYQVVNTMLHRTVIPLVALMAICLAGCVPAGGTGPTGQRPQLAAPTLDLSPSRVPFTEVVDVDQPLHTIAEAEAEAKTFARSEVPEKIPFSFHNAPLGTVERTCVTVGSDADNNGIRSGEFVVGNFQAYHEFWQQDPDNSKLWWQPLHAAQMTELRIRATRLDEPTTTVGYRETQTAFSDHGSFYPTVIPLPSGGTWMLVATSGTDWGCFVVTLPPRTS